MHSYEEVKRTIYSGDWVHRDGEISIVVHSHKEIKNPTCNGDQVTRDGEGKPISSGEKKQSGISQLQLASVAWLERGFKFGGESSGNCRDGDSKNLCKPNSKHGVGQQLAKEGMEVEFLADSRESKE